MGISKVTMTSKIEMENIVWLEGMKQNVFPWISRSAMVNLFLTYLRLANANGDITLTPAAVQAVLNAHSTRQITGCSPVSKSIQSVPVKRMGVSA